jgi:hypothetical protein
MKKENTHDMIKSIVKKNIEVSDEMTELLDEGDYSLIEDETEDVLKDVVPELNDPRRKLVTLIACREIATKIESEELLDMVEGNMQRWKQKHG